MTSWRLFPATNGPNAPVSFGGNFLAGVLFKVTKGGCWFEGYWWWVCPTGAQPVIPQKFALWQITAAGTGTLYAGSVVTSGTLTAGWNFIPLASPLPLAIGYSYNACTGFTGSFPDSDTTGAGTGAADSYGTGGHTSGITQGPLHAYSDTGLSSPEPWGTGQGVFSTASNDPSVNMPASVSNSANFWMDLQVRDTDPAGFTGPYEPYPGAIKANPATTADASVDYVVGTEFRLTAECSLGQVAYFSPPGTSQLATSVTVWRVEGLDSGTIVAVSNSPSWSGAAGSGWVRCTFSGITLPPGTYKVTVFNNAVTPDGWSAKDASTSYWASGDGANGITWGPLIIPGLSAASLAYEFNGSAGGSTPPFTTGVIERGQCTFAQSGHNDYPYLYVTGLAQNYWVVPVVTPTGAGFSEVSAGPVAATLSPSFGQATAAGNLLVAWMFSNSNGVSAPYATSSPGWSFAIQFGTSFSWGAIAYKQNSSAGESPPVFTAGGTSFAFSKVAEFSGGAVSSALDQTGNGGFTGGGTQSAVASAHDGQDKNLVIGAFGWNGGTSGLDIATSLEDGAANTLAWIADENSVTGTGSYYDFTWGVTTAAGTSGDTAGAILSGFENGTSAVATFRPFTAPSAAPPPLAPARPGRIWASRFARWQHARPRQPSQPVAGLVTSAGSLAMAPMAMAASGSVPVSIYGAWAFDEGGGSTITDYSGNGRNMTISGSNSWVAGKYYANAFQSGTSGSDGAEWNGGTTLPALSGDVTLMLWYRHTATADTESHAGGLYSSPGTARLSIWSYRSLLGVAASPEATIRDSTGTLTSYGVSGSHTDSSWHNVAIVYHASGLIEEYLDGSLVKSSSPTANPIGTTVVIIGVGSELGSADPQAVVQDMRVFNSALAAPDVVTWMNTPVHAASPSTLFRPLAAPGAAWRRYHRLGIRRPPQPGQPDTAAGSAALAPMAMHGTAAVTIPASSSLAMAPMSLHAQGTVTDPSQGSQALAPMRLAGIAAVTAAQPSGQLARPGRSWRRRFRRAPSPPPSPALPFQFIQASAAWGGTGTMSLEVVSGPDLASLWAAYLNAKNLAIAKHQELQLARGAYNTDGWGHVLAAQFYVLDRAADAAYKAWAEASEASQRQHGIFAAYGGGQ